MLPTGGNLLYTEALVFCRSIMLVVVHHPLVAVALAALVAGIAHMYIMIRTEVIFTRE